MKPTTLAKTASKILLPKFNYVIRDHNQGAFTNGQVPTDLAALSAVRHFDSLNQQGEEHFGKLETGGQEYGSYVMSFRELTDLFGKMLEATPNGTEFRSLTRGGYGNSVAPLHAGDLEKYLGFVNDQTKGRTAFKVFDYNTNINEMQHCVKTLQKLGAKIEIAIPHTPEESYQPFFVKKVEEAAKLAAAVGADLSIKRMVTGLGVEDAKRVGGIVFPLALKYGIGAVGLHAHGNVPEAAAEFVKTGIDHGVSTNTDFVHKGSGGTFPNIYDIGDALAKRNYNLEFSSQQLTTLGEIDNIQQGRDKRYAAIRVGGAWSEKSKIEMGMPDGGESYSVEAIGKSKYSKIAGVSPEAAKEIFEVYYKEFRERFAMPTSVTPGHKRIETGTIFSVEKTLETILPECKNKDGIDFDKMAKMLKTQSHDQLYSGMSVDIVDAFRNDKLPQKLSDEAMKFLCAEHMKTTLKQDAFKGLHQEAKDLLVAASFNSEAVQDLAKKLVQENKLPPEVLTAKADKFSPISLVQASGERAYLESDKAPERFKTCHEKISERVVEGTKVSNITNAAIIAAALTGGDITYVDGSYRGVKPSAEGLTAEEHKKATADFYVKNLVNLSANKTHSLPLPGRMMELGADGYFSGSVIDEGGNDQPGKVIQPTGKTGLAAGSVEKVR